jgi:hypothetical protein
VLDQGINGREKGVMLGREGEYLGVTSGYKWLSTKVLCWGGGDFVYLEKLCKNEEIMRPL